MSIFNLKQLALSLFLVFFLLVGWEIISSMGVSYERPAQDESEVEKSAFLEQEKPVEQDLSSLYGRYELMQPEKETSTDVNSDGTIDQTTAPVIDKTLKPNFKGLDSDNQVGLIAMFENPEKFAVVELTNYETRVSEFKKIRKGDEIGEYKLTEFSALSITLSNGKSHLQLALFEPDSKPEGS